MFFSLLFKEIRFHLLTFRFAAALITTLTLVLLSMWVLGDDYIRRRNTYNLSVETTARQIEEVYVPSQISPTLHRPPSALSIFAQGEDRRFGNTLQVRRWEVPRRAEGSFTDNMLMAAMPALDLYTIFAVVLSLFGILFTYDAVCGERENGTLKLQCSGGASRGAIFAAKFFGALACLAIPILFSLLGGFLLLTFFFSLTFTAEQWLAVSAMVGAGLIYCALFIAVGLACSALVRRSSVALILALLVWTLAVLVLPSASKSAADVLHPLPSPAEVSNFEKVSEREVVEQASEFAKEYPGYNSGWWTSNFGLPGNGDFLKYDGREEWFRHAIAYVRFIEPVMQGRADRIWDVYGRHDKEMENQASAFGLLAMLSPTIHLREAFTGLANTDYNDYYRFVDSARRFRRQMIDEFARKGFFSDKALAFFTRRKPAEILQAEWEKRYEYYRQRLEAGATYDDIIGPQFWGPLSPEQMPRFTPAIDHPDFELGVNHSCVLGAVLAIVFAAGVVAFLRYDVR
ncbi:MAG TPA: ABC transporter permease subunit [Acidobacteriota bacterium]|nr:ABC transporter permease subunit [Acidobacteriota bacterium]